MDTQPHEVTLLLARVRSEDKESEDRLYNRQNHWLPGAKLVNEVYLRLAGAKLSLRDRAQISLLRLEPCAGNSLIMPAVSRKYICCYSSA